MSMGTAVVVEAAVQINQSEEDIEDCLASTLFHGRIQTNWQLAQDLGECQQSQALMEQRKK